MMLEYEDMHLGDTPLYRLYQGDELLWEYIDENTELSGAPPLYLIGYGTALTDYRIYGASGGVGTAVTGGREVPVTLRNGAQTRSYTVTFEGDPLYERDYVSFSDQKVYRTISFWSGTIEQGNCATNGPSIGGTLYKDPNTPTRLCCFDQVVPFAGFTGLVHATVQTSRTDKTLQVNAYNLTNENVRLPAWDGNPGYAFTGSGGTASGTFGAVEGTEKIAFGFRFTDNSAISPSDITGFSLITDEAFPTEETTVLPAIAAPSGENTLRIGTTVQPDNVWIYGEIRSSIAYLQSAFAAIPASALSVDGVDIIVAALVACLGMLRYDRYQYDTHADQTDGIYFAYTGQNAPIYVGRYNDGGGIKKCAIPCYDLTQSATGFPCWTLLRAYADTFAIADFMYGESRNDGWWFRMQSLEWTGDSTYFQAAMVGKCRSSGSYIDYNYYHTISTDGAGLSGSVSTGIVNNTRVSAYKGSTIPTIDAGTDVGAFIGQNSVPSRALCGNGRSVNLPPGTMTKAAPLEYFDTVIVPYITANYPDAVPYLPGSLI